MEYKDYYKILGVARDAPKEEIKRAYRKLARKYHPDVSKEPDAAERFKEIAEAYHALKDPERRKAYDQLGEHWREGQEFRPPPGWDVRYYTTNDRGFEGRGDFEFSDFFRSVFGGGWPFTHERGEPLTDVRGSDLHARLQITLEDSYHGHTLGFSLQTAEMDKKGELHPHLHNLKVKIPQGVTAGQQIRIAGHGSPGTGKAPPGDLYLTVAFEAHRLFESRGRDIYLTLPVTPWEAALGAQVKVPTLGGRVELKVPAGSQSGTKLRLRGRGLPGSPTGDQFVVLQIVTPKAETEAAKELYRRLAQTVPYNPRAQMGG